MLRFVSSRLNNYYVVVVGIYVVAIYKKNMSAYKNTIANLLIAIFLEAPCKLPGGLPEKGRLRP